MELYQLIATVNNPTAAYATFTFDWIPENFEGIKIAQKFSFQNPIGFTPKFSVDTIKVIKNDKVQIDAIFDTYGLESSIFISIGYLKSIGFGYDLLSSFEIDFETYEKFDDYSEFSLKSISVIDYYNKVKNTERTIPLNLTGELPTTQRYINYVSLKSTFTYPTIGINFILPFSPNNDSKFYNDDFTPLSTITVGDQIVDNAVIYEFGKMGNMITPFTISASGKIIFSVPQNTVNVCKIVCSLMKFAPTPVTLVTIFEEDIKTTTFAVDIKVAAFNNPLYEFFWGDKLYVKIEVVGLPNIIFSADGSFFIDLKRETAVKAINSGSIKYESAGNILESMFNDNLTFSHLFERSLGVTSSSHLENSTETMIIKPKEFLSDYCAMLGLIVNFKNDGSVFMDKIGDFFDDLLQVVNAIEITDFKDLSIKSALDLNLKSVTVGQEKSDYDIYTYVIDWNKKLTFDQGTRNASENIDLSLQKYRADFSGILDYYLKRSGQKVGTSKDNFIFNIDNYVANVVPSIYLYDKFTHRDTLERWRKYLSFAFQNFNKNTLSISSDGGTPDNLQISGVKQMDNFVLAETPRLLPIEYNFTCTIGFVDFSENIIKINHNSEDIYLFVIDAETTDQLTEQKIKALKIQF